MSGILGMAQDAGMFTVHQTIGSVLCCKCGIRMQPNAANMCVKCLRSEVDITEGLLKRLVLVHCPECESYLQPPRTWVKLQLESKELLTFCLKKLQKNMNINKVKLVNAEFIWTEPHSKRVKVKVSVQKEVYNGAILEQSYLVEYVQQDHMCESCSRVAANPDQWVAAVQLRQHVSHRRTFYYLEQLILRHGAAARAVRIKQMDHGIDFYFSNRSHGNKFVEFIGKVAPVKSRSDKQLVSHDSKSNNYNYKYTFSVEISPICREDLICLPPKAAAILGNIGPIVICTKVTNSIALLDPLTLKFGFLDAEQYWRTSFKSLLTSRQLVEYIVFDIEAVSSEVTVGGTKYVLADAQVARVSDFGSNDTMFSIRTHLGHLLKPGDHALGYDLYGANTNDMELDRYKGYIPEVVLIKKSYEEKRQKKRGKARPWKLKSLNMEVDDKIKVDEDKRDAEYEHFLKDLEENPELRFNISLYQNNDYQPSEVESVTDGDGEELPSVPFNELLSGFEELGLDENVDDEDSMAE
jgi:nonsense-mediated mRNA decay protein 3